MKQIVNILKNNNENFIKYLFFNIIYIVFYYFTFTSLENLNNNFYLILNILLSNLFVIIAFYYLGRKYNSIKIEGKRVIIFLILKTIYNLIFLITNLLLIKFFLDLIFFYFDYLYLIKRFSIKNSLIYSREIIKVTILKVFAIIFFYSFLLVIIFSFALKYYFIYKNITPNNHTVEQMILNISRFTSIFILIQVSTVIEVYNIYFKKEGEN